MIGLLGNSNLTTHRGIFVNKASLHTRRRTSTLLNTPGDVEARVGDYSKVVQYGGPLQHFGSDDRVFTVIPELCKS